ncbi:MAG: hypothetical protein K2L07_14450 [Lachnospiraceae bacterium]|nr:hypothetical protein [Lachnospiraceae bacterium]
MKKGLSRKEARRDKIGGFIRALYADFTDSIFSEKEYLEIKAGYISELEELDTETAGLKAEMEGLARDYARNGKKDCGGEPDCSHKPERIPDAQERTGCPIRIRKGGVRKGVR